MIVIQTNKNHHDLQKVSRPLSEYLCSWCDSSGNYLVMLRFGIKSYRKSDYEGKELLILSKYTTPVTLNILLRIRFLFKTSDKY